MRDFLDFDSLRTSIFDNVATALATRFPLSNSQYTLELTDINYEIPKFTLKDQKKALLSRNDLVVPIKGRWILKRNADGAIVDQKRGTVLRVPYLTERGTFILNGNEVVVANQMRLKPGAYTRVTESGEVETHVNSVQGGPSFRVYMEPDTSIFRIKVGQATPYLYPFLKGVGISDKQLREWWGEDIYNANVTASNKPSADAAAAKLYKAINKEADKAATIEELFKNYKFDEEVSKLTLGKPYKSINTDFFKDVTQRIIRVARGEDVTDDRDSLLFQEVYSPDDLLAERIFKDAGNVANKLLWNSTRKGKLDVSTNVLGPYIDNLVRQSGLAQYLEESNPLDIVDQATRLTRMGDGGISDVVAVPLESRMVQPTSTMFIDPIRSPESEYVGVDLRAAYGTKKGPDHKLYTTVKDLRTGKDINISVYDTLANPVAFPGELEQARKKGTQVRVLYNGEIHYMNPEDVPYEMKSYHYLFNPLSLNIPMISTTKGGRLLMGSRVQSQALPLVQGEAPLVMPVDDKGVDSFYKNLSKFLGAVKANTDGVVTEVTPDKIVVTGLDGKVREHELYDNFIFNRKTYIYNTPLVKKGDVVKKGTILAKSNYTDEQGNMALGTNLRVAYMPYKGLNYEDAIVVSDDAAKKLTSEHMLSYKLDLNDMVESNKAKFIGLYPAVYNKDQLDKLDEKGVIKPGMRVEYGDPLVLGIEKRPPVKREIYHGKLSLYKDKSITWDKKQPGIVTDIWSDDEGIKVAVKTYKPLEVGDKLTNFAASKGVVSAIVPTDKMPRDSEGRPIDIIMNPLSIISRGNPLQMYEAILGRIAEKRGRPYVVPAFTEQDMREFVKSELKAHNMSDTEDLIDPDTNKKIKGVLTGKMYFLKLHHLAEDKLKGRSYGAYSAEGAPIEGDEEDSPKRVGLGEMHALLSHGAVKTIKDIKLVKGQRNFDYWNKLIGGFVPKMPDTPLQYKKFMAMLAGAGINIRRTGNALQLMAMTDKDVERLSRGAITNPESVAWEASREKGVFNEKSLEPVPGGLFDPAITGGHNGNYFGHIELPEPMPNPVMEQSIKVLLGLTQDQYEKIISGEMPLGRYGTGGTGIKNALGALNIDTELQKAYQDYKNAESPSARDKAIKKLRVLDGLKTTGLNPADLVVTKVPVIPPIFRPIVSNAKFTSINPVNLLYSDLINLSRQFNEVKERFTGEPVHTARRQIYNAFKALVGLGSPVSKHRVEKVKIKGILEEVFGNSPKLGIVQRKLLGTTTDISGRAVITPNPDLDIDQIGIPEDKAWDLYKPFVMQRLVKQFGGGGDAKLRAMKLVEKRDPLAMKALQEEMAYRPVLVSRAPHLHRYSIMGFLPVLTKNNTLEVPPQLTEGFAGDFDGDCIYGYIYVTMTPGVECALAKLHGDNYLAKYRVTDRRIIKQLNVRSGNLYAINLEEFPHIQIVWSRKGINGPIYYYNVLPGIKVLAHSGTPNRFEWADLNGYSVHPGRKVVIVTLESGRQLITDDDPRAVYALDTTEYILKRYTPDMAYKNKVYVPVVPIKATDRRPKVKQEYTYGFVFGYFLLYYGANYMLSVPRRRVTARKLLNEVKELSNVLCKAVDETEHVIIDYMYTVCSALIDEGTDILKHIEKNSNDFKAGFAQACLDYFENGANKCNHVIFNKLEAILRLKHILALRNVNLMISGRLVKNEAMWYCRAVRFPELADDMIPIPVTVLERIMNKVKDPLLKADLKTAIVADRLPRADAKVLYKRVKKYLRTQDAPLSQLWKNIIDNTKVRWEPVTGINNTGIAVTGYDLTVAGYNTMVDDCGVTRSNTLNFHVVSSPEAVKEVKEKTLASRNTRSPGRFEPMYAPRHEFLYGLYLATRPSRAGIVSGLKFKNAEDVAKAYARGEVNLDTIVDIEK